MIETKTVVICDRCKKVAGTPPISGYDFTAGYYDARAWSKFTNPGEVHVCASCMWDDPRYIAVYGVQKQSAKEFRYGDDRTIHRTANVNVEVDHKGKVAAVWFRCAALPFDQRVVAASRAQEMHTMYQEHKMDPIQAIVFADGSNG